MQMNMKSAMEKPVKVNLGINKTLVFSTCMFLLIFIAILTSGLWLPDSRELMVLNNNNDMTFNKKVLQCNEFFVDDEKALGEISCTVKLEEMANFEDLSFKMTLDGVSVYNEESYRVIYGSVLPTLDKSKFQQEILIQFGVPDDFYYLSLIIEQLDNKALEYQMDYRNFKHQKLADKGDKYLVGLDDINIEIIKQQSIVTELEKEVQGYKDSNDVLTKEINALEIKIKAITDEVVLSEQKKIIEGKKKAIEDNKGKLEEREGLLQSERQSLVQLEQEKAKQR